MTQMTRDLLLSYVSACMHEMAAHRDANTYPNDPRFTSELEASQRRVCETRARLVDHLEKLEDSLGSAVGELERVNDTADGRPLVSHNLLANLRSLNPGTGGVK